VRKKRERERRNREKRRIPENFFYADWCENVDSPHLSLMRLSRLTRYFKKTHRGSSSVFSWQNEFVLFGKKNQNLVSKKVLK